jgi:hypothetical protein
MTRSNKKIETEGKRIAELASRYRAIRQKLVVLSSVLNESGWQDTLQVLEDKDIQGLTTEDNVLRAVGAQAKKDRLGAGRKQLTWIWFVGGHQRTGGEDESGDVDDSILKDDPALRMEFCSTRARAHRWQEECLLLAQEMDRVERFWEWDAVQWRQRGATYAQGTAPKLSLKDMEHPELVDQASRVASELDMGKRAYTERQAAIRQRLREDAVRQHSGIRARLNEMVVLGERMDATQMVECMAAPSSV